ncbi:MAG: hypothetical protein ACRC7D_20945 [Aeromonas popoffii]|uniref:hypothetical protein n=1 Tax=Aeromonas popoffii TaxID=70856 RepID=UPI003F319F28
MSELGAIKLVFVESNDGKKTLGYIVLVDGEQFGPVYLSLADAVIALINIAVKLGLQYAGLQDADLRKIKKYVNDLINEQEVKNKQIYHDNNGPT